MDLLEKVKRNLILQHDQDDDLLQHFITAAINYAERYQQVPEGTLALDEIVWLITLFANQSVLIHNLRHKDTPRELLTEEAVELLTTPLDLAGFKSAITEAMFKGTARNILSESDESKNAPSG